MLGSGVWWVMGGEWTAQTVGNGVDNGQAVGGWSVRHANGSNAANKQDHLMPRRPFAAIMAGLICVVTAELPKMYEKNVNQCKIKRKLSYLKSGKQEILKRK